MSVAPTIASEPGSVRTCHATRGGGFLIRVKLAGGYCAARATREYPEGRRVTVLGTGDDRRLLEDGQG